MFTLLVLLLLLLLLLLSFLYHSQIDLLGYVPVVFPVWFFAILFYFLLFFSLLQSFPFLFRTMAGDRDGKIAKLSGSDL